MMKVIIVKWHERIGCLPLADCAEWEAVREHTKKTDSVSKCKRGAARSVALTIDEIQAGSCFVRNTWLRKYNQPSPVSTTLTRTQAAFFHASACRARTRNRHWGFDNSC